MYSSEEWKSLLKTEKLYFFNIYDLVYATDYFKTMKNLLQITKPLKKFIYKDKESEICYCAIKCMDSFHVPNEIIDIIMTDARTTNKRHAARIIMHYYRKYYVTKHFRDACERFLQGRIV
jgi:hypothetical protein